MKRTFAGELRKTDAGGVVTLHGWVHKQRDFGELVFVDLRDRSGICQVVVDRERGATPELIAAAKELRGEFVVRIEGTVAERADAQKNPKLPSGEIELVATGLEILARADTPPFVVEDDTDASEDLRLEYRYLDLRRPALARNLILRHKMLTAVRNYFDRLAFLEIETPILTKSTPEGARDYLVPSRVHKGEFYALPQSPQIFKQLCMVAGLERYFQIARCFRDEDLRRDRQPEFTQIDVEASFIDEEFIYSTIEGLFEEIFPLAGVEVKTPFPRMTWQEAMNRFGIDRPDTRFGMELVDVTSAAKQIAFEPFQSAETVRAIVVPGAAGFSRKQIDALTEEAKKLRAGGLVWMKFDAQKGSSIRKFLDDAAFDALRTTLGAGEGDLALLIAGKTSIVLDVLGSLRLLVARQEKMIPEDRFDFLWVTDFPLFEWDDETERFYARHHPFTSPAPGHDDLMQSDPGVTLARAYDVVLNGIELGGGSIRINRPDVQAKMFRALGITDEEASKRFGFLLEAFRYGAPPHGGIALGVDRMVMLMARADSLRDVIAFPKTARAQDLMSSAPSEVDTRQLDELGIAVKPRP